MKIRLLVFCALILAGKSLFGASDNKSASPTPVSTVKAFFTALADGDKARIQALAVSNPKLKTLYAKPPTKEEQEAFRALGNAEFRVLRPGETVPMGEGVMTAPPPSDKLVFVYLEGMLYPLPVSRVDNAWRVNAAPLINDREKGTAIGAAPAKPKK